MVIVGSLQLFHEFGLGRNHRSNIQYKSISGRSKLHLFSRTPSLNILHLRQNSWSNRPSENLYRPLGFVPYRSNAFKCRSFQVRSQGLELPAVKAVSTAVVRSYNALQGSPVFKMVPAVGLIIFAFWGLVPIARRSRTFLLNKGDWKKSRTHYVATSFIRPLLLWTGTLLMCRALDPVNLPTAASQIVKQRLLYFAKSLSTVLTFAYCLSSLIEPVQKFVMERGEPSDARNMGFQFAGKVIHSAVWVVAASLFMELLGYSTQSWLTAGGLWTVLVTLAGREIITNFLSSAIIHTTRPFVVNEWIQTKIEGYDVSGTVEKVGWISPTVVRGEDREAIHIPNHKFTVNVVRNLTQKTHWRIKTHLAISQLDGHKIKNVISDMRKVLSKNPLVDQRGLHRRVFFDNVNPENQAFLILVSCFIKTPHYEEYLRVKETILLDLLRVISHHGARLATPIRTVQKTYTDLDLENIPFTDSIFSRGGVNPKRPLLLIDSYKINGEDKAKNKTTGRSTSDSQADPKAAAAESKEVLKAATASTSTSDSLAGDKATVKSTSKSAPKTSSNNVGTTRSDSKGLEPVSADLAQNKKMPDSKPLKPSQAADSDKSSVFRESLQSREGERPSVSQPAVSIPTLEENIVLGVALDGSKRTLPIEEELASPSTPEVKKLTTAHLNRNGSPPEKDGQIPGSPNSSSDHRDKPER